ncbi:transcriptional regulator, TetR family [Terriglobus roseus]|uniref:Transcriptional regulator, TetR family n=2 Tax=Terriglobus roseus TaxID=392734 RepID=A0A1G7KWE1_9BACT|nr:transcriptional regulator, TetR family [Terriglobus roseus]
MCTAYTEFVMKKESGQDHATDSLKQKIVQAASHLFTSGGYDALSMRRVAQEAGCSQMAMYRHFENKEALVQHICADLYTKFATRINGEIAAEPDATRKLRRFIAAVLQFAEQYPDHYSLIFLVRHADPEVVATREQLGQQFLEGIAGIVREALPPGTPLTQVRTTLRRMMEVLHGTTALWLAHPTAYKLTRQRAVEDVEAIWSLLLNQ